MRLNFVWPWQWKKIAETTLAELQTTREKLRSAENHVTGLQLAIDRHLEDKRKLTAQVRAMSER